MFMRSRAGRTIIAALLTTSLAAVTASPTALAQERGKSRMPAAAGNPMADLQQQINSLSALQRQIDTLKTQVEVLSAEAGARGTSTTLGVFDNNDQRIGDVVGVQDSIPWVSLRIEDRLVLLQVFPNQLATIGHNLWFELPNCTGQAYIESIALSHGNVFTIGAVYEPGGVVYAPVQNAAPERKPFQSLAMSSGKCFAMTTSRNVVPASQVLRLDDFFQRPYSVR